MRDRNTGSSLYVPQEHLVPFSDAVSDASPPYLRQESSRGGTGSTSTGVENRRTTNSNSNPNPTQARLDMKDLNPTPTPENSGHGHGVVLDEPPSSWMYVSIPVFACTGVILFDIYM